MTNILAEKAQRVKDRIYHAMRMYHNAHDNWSSEEIEPGVSYLDWIYAAIDDQAAALHEIEQAAEQRGIERAAKVADRLAWSNGNTQFLGPEQNCVRVAAAIRALPTTAEPAKGA